MKFILDQSERLKPKVIIEFTDLDNKQRKIECRISLYGTSIANKFSKYVSDMQDVLEHSDYEKVFARLYKYHRKFSGDVFIEDMLQVYNEFKSKSKKFQDWLELLSTSTLDVPREQTERLIEFIYMNKLLFPFTHLSCFESIKDKIFQALIKRYKEELDRLYEVIYTKIKYNMADKVYLGYMRNALDIDYIVHYNYDFAIFTSSILYVAESKKHPLSYLVSVAADNTSFLVATYSSVSKEKYDDTKVEEVTTSKGNLLINITDELVIFRLLDMARLLTNKYNVVFDFNVRETNIYTHIIVPILSKILGVSHHKLLTLEKQDKYYIMWLMYYLFITYDELKELINRKAFLFLIAEQPSEKRKKSSGKTGLTKSHILMFTNELKIHNVYIQDLLIELVKNLPPKGQSPLIIKHRNVKINDETLWPIIRLAKEILIDEKHIDTLRENLFNLMKFNKITSTDFKRAVKK